MANRSILLSFIIILIFSLFFVSPGCAKKEKEFYKVIEVHDGDTVTIVTESFFGFLVRTERVRLIGIDAPELGQEPWGRRAKNYLRKLLQESDFLVKVELDIQHRDKYGRLLAYLWDKNSNMINYMMVRNGYAMVYTVPPNVKYAELFIEAQKLARQEKRGIWSSNDFETPSQWRKTHPRK